MERERAFLIEQKPIEMKSSRKYERDEILSDISAFPKEVQPLVKKHFAGGLSPEEERSFGEARDEWWQDKYGFRYDDKASRAETLRRKYAPAAEVLAAKKLQDEMFEAFKDGDHGKIDEVQKKYVEAYPEQLEGVIALFNLVPFMERRQVLERPDVPPEERKKLIEENTQDQFVLTHFIAVSGEDKEFLRLFWDAAERLAKDKNRLVELNRMRRGVLSQVAVYKVFQALGLNPKLSHPKEDAFHATDLWSESGHAIQVKGHREGAGVISTEEISPSGVQVEDDRGVRHFDSYLNHEMQKFRMKVKRYGALLKKPMKGYLVQVPYSEFDAVTGEPTPKIIEFVKQNLPKSEDMKREGGRAFTLVEMLVTVAIIGILASIVMPALNSALKSGRDAKRKASVAQIGRFFSMGACFAPSGGPGDYDLGDLFGEVLAKNPQFSQYISAVPKDPRGGTEAVTKYRYVVSDDLNKCAVYANLENAGEETTLKVTSPTPGGGTGVLQADTPGPNGTTKYFQVSN